MSSVSAQKLANSYGPIPMGAQYGNLGYGNGLRAAPTLREEHVYTLGVVGYLPCLNAETGEVIWAKDTEAELNAERSQWGFAASPVIWSHLVIAYTGVKCGGCLVAFNCKSGEEVWRSTDDHDGYCTPIRIENEGHEQIICWTPENVLGISPHTDEVYWSVPCKVTNSVSIATPIFQEGLLFVSGY